ncbi:unnamed protein product [Sphagnum troendelagicum]|uniref:Uncharacterized protein n=1 Tax=Sphagnum troendelagicum TaxID=128251 RepID=A0ABP0TU57_9BRYO
MERGRPRSRSPELRPMCSVAPGRSFGSLIGSLTSRSVVVGPRSSSLRISIPRVLGTCPGLADLKEVPLWDLTFLRMPQSQMTGACSGTCYPFCLVWERNGSLLPAQSF